ncbi:MAG: nicotinamide riboside transporter PnuC [Anaerovoracaceae bacterium]
MKQELSGWNKSEAIWLCFATLTILALSLYWKDSVIGIIAAITGVLCVVLTGKGKISSYVFGMINTLLYAYVAFGAKYYGEVMLNLLYYVPMNFVGWFAWKKYINTDTGEVAKRKLSAKFIAMLFTVIAIAAVIYGLLLSGLGGNLPYIDSISTVLSVVAQILCVRRYREQWLLWIVVNAVTIIMWIIAFWNGGESVATLLMWSIYFINALIMYRKWSKEAQMCDIK